MSPGIPEEVGSTARSVIDVFKSTPALLSILMFNIFFLLALIYGAHLAAERWEALVEKVLLTCGKTSMLL